MAVRAPRGRPPWSAGDPEGEGEGVRAAFVGGSLPSTHIALHRRILTRLRAGSPIR